MVYIKRIFVGPEFGVKKTPFKYRVESNPVSCGKIIASVKPKKCMSGQRIGSFPKENTHACSGEVPELYSEYHSILQYFKAS